VLLTNGVDEAIHLLCQTYLEAGDETLIVVPTYSMYRIYAMSAGAGVISVPAGEDFAFPAEDLKRRISDRTRLICIANPNNPTGAVASPEALIQIARSAPAAAVLVDEAYVEYYGKTFLDHRRDLPNVFVARTFSKVYGLAGLRLGVLIGDPEQMRSVRLVASPYNVNAAALACLPEAIADQNYVSQYVSEVLAVRDRLEKILDEVGVQHWRSQANFVLMRVGPCRADAAGFVESMRRRGVLVRDRSSDHGCEGCVRITVGTKEQSARMLGALQESFEELSIAQGASRP
jgi:histidinol-phosphate aminotransferase